MGIESQTMTPFTDNLLRAGRELGYSIRDPNSNSPNVAGKVKLCCIGIGTFLTHFC